MNTFKPGALVMLKGGRSFCALQGRFVDLKDSGPYRVERVYMNGDCPRVTAVAPGDDPVIRVSSIGIKERIREVDAHPCQFMEVPI